MIILGVDPGTARTGYGVINKKGSKYEVIDYGLIETSKDTPPAERLEFIHKDILRIIKRNRPRVLVIEDLFFSWNVKTAMSVGESRGVIKLAASLSSIEIREYTPVQVKMALTGAGNADKNQVGVMVKGILGLKEIPKPDDVADALAIAVTYASSSKMEEIKKGKYRVSGTGYKVKKKK